MIRKNKNNMNYYEYLKSERWLKIREELFELRGEKCEKCGKTKSLHIHHKTYINLFKEKLHELQILCNKCHSQLHVDKKEKIKKSMIDDLKRHQEKYRRKDRILKED